MKNQIKGFIMGIIFMLVLSGVVFAGEVTRSIEVIFNSIRLSVNGNIVDADNILYNGTTYVPLRKAAEILGKEVTWNQSTRTASITDSTNYNIGYDSNNVKTYDSIIESRIDGEFTGWEGETIFKLQNGQIWQQSSFSYKYSYKYSPEVLIYKSGQSYKMKVDGVDGEISVTRIK